MTDLEPVAEEDEPRAFYRKPAWQRAVMLSAGSIMHFVLALVLFYIAFAVFGAMRARRPSRSWRRSAPCVAGSPRRRTCAAERRRPRRPQAAGLKPGDQVVAVDGTPSRLGRPHRRDPGQARPAGHAGGRSGTVQQQDRRLTTPSPRSVRHGRPEQERDGRRDRHHARRRRDWSATGRSSGPADVSARWAACSVPALAAVASLPAKIGQLVGVVFDDQPRDPNGAVGVVGISPDQRRHRRSSDLPPAGARSHAPDAAGRRSTSSSASSTCCRCCRWTAATSPSWRTSGARAWLARRSGAAGAAAPGPEQAAAGGVRRDRSCSSA